MRIVLLHLFTYDVLIDCNNKFTMITIRRLSLSLSRSMFFSFELNWIVTNRIFLALIIQDRHIHACLHTQIVHVKKSSTLIHSITLCLDGRWQKKKKTALAFFLHVLERLVLDNNSGKDEDIYITWSYIFPMFFFSSINSKNSIYYHFLSLSLKSIPARLSDIDKEKKSRTRKWIEEKKNLLTCELRYAESSILFRFLLFRNENLH
jgi:hypothetical protein